MSNPRQLISGLVARVTPPGGSPAARRAVTDEELAAVLGAARVAPSADNLQTWRFITVRQAETRARLAGAVPLSGAIERASVAIVVCGVKAVVKRVRREQPFLLIDVAIAISHLLLEAGELELPCAWTLEVDEAACRTVLGIPEDVRVLAVLALG